MSNLGVEEPSEAELELLRDLGLVKTCPDCDGSGRARMWSITTGKKYRGSSACYCCLGIGYVETDGAWEEPYDIPF